MRIKTITLTAAAFAVAASVASGASVIVDPSFETPLIDDGSGVDKWLPFSSAALPTIETDTPRTGNSYANINLGGVEGQFAGVFQDISVLPGDAITLDLFHFALNNDPTAIQIRIEWQGAGAEVARTADSTPSPGATYENFSITHIAPANADTARVVYVAQSFGPSPDAVIGIDDFTATGSTVPEPSGAILLSLGALGFLARRKRV